MANDGYLQGWHERNGGNLSYRLKAEEVEMIRPRLNAPGEWTPIGTEVPGLAGVIFPCDRKRQIFQKYYC